MYIRNLRKAQQIKSKDLAEKLNLKPSSYSDKEKGRRRFTSKEICILCELFNVNITALDDLKE